MDCPDIMVSEIKADEVEIIEGKLTKAGQTL
jgi:hypothetical protein